MNRLFILLGPTAVGKTTLSLEVAERLQGPIISADSRQLYKELVIGTAAPTPAERARVTHHMVGTLSLHDYYSASQFEEEVLRLLQTLYLTTPNVVMTGGSMMYLDAVSYGIDQMPTVTPEVRQAVLQQYEQEGLAPLLEELHRLDPTHYEVVDRQNYKRVIHAVEICRMTARPYSSFCTHQKKSRPFQLIPIGLTRPREELCERINQRVDQMMADGLLEEAKRLHSFRHLNALNTVGYKELFTYFDGTWSLPKAVEKIKRNTRVYARKQMNWFKRNPDITWFHPDQKTEIFSFIDAHLR